MAEHEQELAALVGRERRGVDVLQDVSAVVRSMIGCTSNTPEPFSNGITSSAQPIRMTALARIELRDDVARVPLGTQRGGRGEEARTNPGSELMLEVEAQGGW